MENADVKEVDTKSNDSATTVFNDQFGEFKGDVIVKKVNKDNIGIALKSTKSRNINNIFVFRSLNPVSKEINKIYKSVFLKYDQEGLKISSLEDNQKLVYFSLRKDDQYSESSATDVYEGISLARYWGKQWSSTIPDKIKSSDNSFFTSIGTMKYFNGSDINSENTVARVAICQSGGTGSESASITCDGESANVTCRDGYYACCNCKEGFDGNTKPECGCRKSL